MNLRKNTYNYRAIVSVLGEMGYTVFLFEKVTDLWLVDLLCLLVDNKIYIDGYSCLIQYIYFYTILYKPKVYCKINELTNYISGGNLYPSRVLLLLRDY